MTQKSKPLHGFSKKVVPNVPIKLSVAGFECDYDTRTQCFKLLLNIPLVKYSIYDVVFGRR